jgi:hypothetical protein
MYLVTRVKGTGISSKFMDKIKKLATIISELNMKRVQFISWRKLNLLAFEQDHDSNIEPVFSCCRKSAPTLKEEHGLKVIERVGS